MLFIFIGDINRLGPIVTMPFLLTYAFVDYAYFVLAMSFDYRRKCAPGGYLHDDVDGEVNYGAVGSGDVSDDTAGLFNSSDGHSPVDAGPKKADGRISEDVAKDSAEKTGREKLYLYLLKTSSQAQMNKLLL